MYRAPETPPCTLYIQQNAQSYSKSFNVAELQYLHEERTSTLQKEERYKVYRRWLIQNGGKIDKIEYPVCYTKRGMLVGIAASKDLDDGEVYLEIPETLTYNRRTVLKSPIGFIIEKHPEVFDKHQEVDLALVLYTFHEKLKGENSFWAPNFDIINSSDLPAFWNDESVMEFQDQIMIAYVKNYKLQYEEDSQQIFKTLRDNNYSEFFPGITDQTLNVELQENFYWCFNAIATRFMQMEFSFKMGCMMSQFDCINHNQHDDTLYKTISEGQVIQKFSEGYTIEPWGVTDFEYFYSRPLKSFQAQRESQLIVDEELMEQFKHGAYGNLTIFEEAKKDKPFQQYQIFTQHKIKKGDQIFLNYGRCNNRYWIINYGFPIRGNEYDGFAVHVQLGESKKVALLFKGKPYVHLLKLAKKQLKLEKEAPHAKEIIIRAIGLIKSQYTNNFNSNPTSLEDDEKLMKSELTWRYFICLIYRMNIKEIIQDNIVRLQDQFQELSR